MAWEGKQLGAFDRLAVKAYYQKLDNADTNTEWRSNGLRILSDYGFKQDSYGLTLEAEHNFQALSAEHQLLWGADLSRTDTSRPRLKTQYNPNGSTSNIVGGETYPNKTFRTAAPSASACSSRTRSSSATVWWRLRRCVGITTR